MRADGLICESFNASLLFEPWQVATAAGNPYRVFTPFWKSCLAIEPPREPVAKPTRLAAPPRWPESMPVDALELLPRAPWEAGLEASWSPGETGAWKQLEAFLLSQIEATAKGDADAFAAAFGLKNEAAWQDLEYAIYDPLDKEE